MEILTLTQFWLSNFGSLGDDDRAVASEDQSTVADPETTEESLDQSKGATQDDEEEALLRGGETIATTPVAGNRTVVDIQNDFQVESASFRRNKWSFPCIKALTIFLSMSHPTLNIFCDEIL